MKQNIVIGIIATAITASAALAATVPWNQALAHYNGGNYKVALGEFKQYTSTYPLNAQAHYYLGLCYREVGNRAEAKSEFSLATKYGTGAVKGYAEKALNSLGAGAGSPVAASVSSAPAPPATVTKILEFYSDTWGACIAFEPVWNETKRKVSGIEFKRYNLGDPGSDALAQKYRVVGPPSLVFLDRSGKVLTTRRGAPVSTEQFITFIKSMQ